jgi:hypothetical protein
LLTVLEARISKIKVPEDLASDKHSSLCFKDGTSLLYPYMVEEAKKHPLASLYYKGSNSIPEGGDLMT